MLGLFDALRDKFKPRLNTICIDNWVFKLHYRVTTLIFFIATILVTCREYIGDHIKCINDIPDPGFQKVIETYCFFTTTFTVVDERSMALYDPAHPGILPFATGSKQTIKKHMYYQWVPFFLFFQAIMFYLTHLLWKQLEDHRIQKLVGGLTLSRFALLDKEVEVADQTIPAKEKRQACINRIKIAFLKRIALNKSWARWFIFCEILNAGHVGVQFYITNKFLGNEFSTLGAKIFTEGSKTLDTVFPKMTKCTFHKYGPSGSIQDHDALCVMALNIINEKIYVFLWFWFIILFAASCLILIWRFFTILLYSRSMILNQLIFGRTERVYSYHIQMVTRHCTYLDWLLLKYLSKNMDSLAFRELFVNICEDLEDTKPLFMFDQSSKTSSFELNKFQ